MDIVDRLEALYGTHPIIQEAAAEIERLRAEIERLRVIRPVIMRAEAKHLGIVSIPGSDPDLSTGTK